MTKEDQIATLKIEFLHLWNTAMELNDHNEFESLEAIKSVVCVLENSLIELAQDRFTYQYDQNWENIASNH